MALISNITAALKRPAVTATIMIALPFILTTVPGFLVVEKCRTKQLNTSQVSGFYGPGVVLGWLLTAYSSILSGEFSLLCCYFRGCIIKTTWLPTLLVDIIRPPKKCKYDAESFDVQPIGLDLNLLGVVAYPLIAFFDVLVRLIRGERFSPQIKAASAVVELSVNYGSALLIYYSILGEYRRHPELIDSFCFHLPYRTWVRRKLLYEALFVFVLFGSWFCVLVLDEFTDALTCIVTWPVRLSFIHFNVFGTSDVSCLEFHTSTAAVYPAPNTWVVGSIFIQIYVLAGQVSNLFRIETPHLCGRLVIPQTSAKLSDLDQATALAIALANVLYPAVTHVYKICVARHSTSMTAGEAQ